MSNSLYNPFLFSAFLDRRTFKGDDGGGGNDGGGGSSSSSSSRTEADVQAEINASLEASGGEWTSELNDLVSERSNIRSGGGSTASTSNNDPGPPPQAQAQKNTIGSVSQTGQYAGDGFEFVENEGGYLTRTYTGANEDAGLGQDVITGGTSDKATKEAIANISLNEGSAFAGSAASATDGDLLNLLNPDIEGTGQSGSYAEQVGQVDYTPTLTYGDDARQLLRKVSVIRLPRTALRATIRLPTRETCLLRSLHLRLQLRWTRALVLCAQLHGPRTYCLQKSRLWLTRTTRFRILTRVTLRTRLRWRLY